MSRGPGVVQRGVIEALAEQCCTDGWLTTEQLAARLAGAVPTRAETESIRRAARRLAEAGRAEMEIFEAPVHVRSARVDRGEFYVYRIPHRAHRAVVAFHAPLSVEEKERRAQSRRSLLDRLVALDSRINARGCGRDG